VYWPISYSVYLFHVIDLADASSPTAAADRGTNRYLHQRCVVFSTLFFYYFEKPILAVRPKFKLAPGKALLTLAQPSSTSRSRAQMSD
jgi:peptidoglycan/LPS O-acetylase OafA/YrhL